MLNIQSAYIGYIEQLLAALGTGRIQADTLEPLRSELADTELLVPVIGAFSSGKSSLLNAFLGENILPVGITPETELATELRYSSDPHLLAIRVDGQSERLPVEAITTIKERSAEFTHLHLYLDNQRLKQITPLVLVDMPGFGSSLANHNKAIAYYLPRGVHFVVLTSIEDGNITSSMMRQLDDVQTYGRDFSFLVSKTNLRADDQVRDVLTLIAEQIEVNYSSAQPVVAMGLDAGEKLNTVLSRVAPEKLFQNLFEDRLKEQNHTLVDQINVALSALKNDHLENERAVSELTAGLRQVERKRDRMLEELKTRHSGNVVDRCISAVGKELEDAQSELVTAGLSGNRESFSRIISEIVRGTLTRNIKEQMNTVSRSIVSEFALELGGLDRAMSNFGNDGGWLNAMSEKINRTLEKTNEALSGWSENLAQKNAAEMARAEAAKSGGTPYIPKNTYRGLATVLAVTTTVVNPVLELVIIFLPDILNFFAAGRQQDNLKRSIVNEVIPSVKRELRSKLPELLGEQMDELVSQISGEFEREITEKKVLIDQLQAQRTESQLTVNEEIEQLVQLKGTLQRLAKETLYVGGQQ